MKRAYLLGTAVSVVGIYMLYRGYGGAQIRGVSLTHKVIELVAGMILAMSGYMIYTYARTYAKQGHDDLDILAKVKTEKK